MILLRKENKGILLISSIGLMLLLFLTTITTAVLPPATAIKLMGQQFFPNGTGIAYFDDGITAPASRLRPLRWLRHSLFIAAFPPLRS